MLHSGYRKYLITCELITTVLFCNSGICFSQSPFNYIWPIDSPFVITANYGELRPNHFHAGIDFSTSGKINLPVYSIEEGYVSRIRVSPYGYGKCVYITHPGGKVSVYAHLNAFSLKIANKAKEHQYMTQNYEIDFMPRPRTMYVRKNEIIGLSGNTGGSTGPHLHFEIRDELLEIPLNPLGFYHLKDHTAPELHSIAFYNLSDTTAPGFMNMHRIKRGRGDSLILDNDHLILQQSIVGLAFSGADRCYPNGNSNNVFAARIYVDDSLVYVHQLNNISFADTRFINEFSERIGKNKFQKCFVPTLYAEGMFGKCINKGRIILDDSTFHKIKLVLSDESGNNAPLQFYLKAKKINAYKDYETTGDWNVKCMEDFKRERDGMMLQIPAKTFFYSCPLLVVNEFETEGKLSILPELNLRQAVTIAFKVPSRLWDQREKLLLKNSSIALPLIRNDSVFYSIKEFGKYTLFIDTVPPKIKIDYSERKLKEAWQMDAFSFRITDDASGIGKYNLWLNNDWVLSEYDAKEDLLTYYFDEETPIGLLQFKLEVIDKVGNRTFLEYTLKK